MRMILSPCNWQANQQSRFRFHFIAFQTSDQILKYWPRLGTQIEVMLTGLIYISPYQNHPQAHICIPEIAGNFPFWKWKFIWGSSISSMMTALLKVPWSIRIYNMGMWICTHFLYPIQNFRTQDSEEGNGRTEVGHSKSFSVTSQ